MTFPQVVVMQNDQLIRHSLIWLEFIWDSINVSEQQLYDLVRNQLLLIFDSPFVRISAIKKNRKQILSCNLLPEEYIRVNIKIEQHNDQQILTVQHRLIKKLFILYVSFTGKELLFEICLNDKPSQDTINLLKSELQSFFKRMSSLKPIKTIDYDIDIQKSELLKVTLSEISKQIRNVSNQIFPADKKILKDTFSILYILPKYEKEELKMLSYIFNKEQIIELTSMGRRISEFETEVSKDSSYGIAPYVAKTKAPIVVPNWYLDKRVTNPEYSKQIDLKKERQLLKKMDLMQIPIVIGNKLQLIVQINGDLANHKMFKWWVEKRCFEISHCLVLVNLLNNKLDLIISPLMPVEYNVIAYGKNIGLPPFAKPIKKSLSVLFLDIKSSSQIYKLLPEISDVVSLINKLFELFYETIIQHGGTIDKFMGDGVLAVFGGFKDCQQVYCLSAVDAALEIKSNFSEYVKKACVKFCLEKKWDKRLDLSNLGIRIGIATDNNEDTIVGEIGSPLRREYTVIGEKVVVASRLINDIGKDLEKENRIKVDNRDIEYNLSKPNYILIDGDTCAALDINKYEVILIDDEIPMRGFNKEFKYKVYELINSKLE